MVALVLACPTKAKLFASVAPLVKINLLGSIFKYEAIFSRDTSTAAEAKTPDRLLVLRDYPTNLFNKEPSPQQPSYNMVLRTENQNQMIIIH